MTEAAVPEWFSILPPLLAIVVALVLRSVIPALFLGIWLGAWGLAGFDAAGLFTGLLDAFQVYVLAAVADPGHAAIMLFSFMIGGLTGVIRASGGTQGIVDALTRHASTRRRGQVATALMGLAIFIDDYANSLIVGKTMRPVTDRLRISREKLAYLVDSTAAPVSAVAVVTTWVGYQVGLIGTALDSAGRSDIPSYLLLLESLPYSFYPWLAIFLVLWTAWSGRDLGPMARAERRALDAPAAPVAPPAQEAVPARAANAVVPLVVLIGGTLAGLFATGTGDSLREIIGSADSAKALMGASLVATLAALVMPAARRSARFAHLVEGWIEGVQSMLPAMIILVLAWSLSAVAEKLGAAPFLVSVLGGAVPGAILPALVFLIAAATAFATGTSWGTMGILIPLVIPLALGLAGGAEAHVLYSSLAAVLAGAVWGDHCSPISDTTILSSMASGCDHIEHVRTQLPYALLAGFVALLVGVVPSGFGFPWWLSLPAGMAVLVGAMRVFGHAPPE